MWLTPAIYVRKPVSFFFKISHHACRFSTNYYWPTACENHCNRSYLFTDSKSSIQYIFTRPEELRARRRKPQPCRAQAKERKAEGRREGAKERGKLLTTFDISWHFFSLSRGLVGVKMIVIGCSRLAAPLHLAPWPFFTMSHALQSLGKMQTTTTTATHRRGSWVTGPHASWN